MNPMAIMSSAEKLSVPELQRSIQSGVIPAFIGVPLLQEKVKRAKQMQMGMAAQQPKRPSVAEQVGQEARQASVEDMMRERARMMQDEMGQTGGISDFLPKPAEEAYAKGGPIAFADGGPTYSRFGNGLTDTYLGFTNTPEYEELVRKYGRGEVAKRIASNLYQGTVGTYIQGAKDFGSRVKGYAESMKDIPEQLAYVTDWYGTENDPRNTVKHVDVEAPQVQQIPPQVVPLQKQPAVIAPTIQAAPAVDKAAPIKPQIDGADQRTMVDRMQLRPAQPTQPTQPAQPAQQAQPQQEERDQSLSDYMKQYREVTGENKGIAALQNRLSEREARLAKEEDRAPWMALMQAGLATMAGTSPNAMSNIGQGGVAGLQAYTRSTNKLEDAKDKSFEIQAKLEEAQRAEELAAGKYGLESVQADKKAKQVAQLEREKMANDMKIHEMTNVAHLDAEKIQAGATLGAAQVRADAYGGSGGAGKPTKLTDQQYYFNRVVEALEANPTWRPDLRHPDGSPNPIAIEAERKKTSTDRRMEGFMGDSMGTSMGSGMMSTQPDPRYRILSQQ